MKQRKLFVPIFILIVLSIACQANTEHADKDAIRVQLKWVHQAQFAGFYLAEENGYYDAEKIDVTFVEGGGGVDIIQEVASGEADFGVAAPDLILAWSITQKQPVKAIATIYRKSPVVFVSLANSGIKKPEDLIGKKVAVAGVPEFELQFQAILAKMGVDEEKVTLVPHTYDLTPLYEGTIDTIGLYATGGLIRMENDGYEANRIYPDDYGVHAYADTIIASDEMIENNPDLVTRFLRATLKGWRDAVGDEDAAVDATLVYALESDAALQKMMMRASVPLIHTGVNHIGWMEQEVWQEMADMLYLRKIIDQPADPSQAFTMEFLNTVYGN